MRICANAVAAVQMLTKRLTCLLRMGLHPPCGGYGCTYMPTGISRLRLSWCSSKAEADSMVVSLCFVS